MNDTKKSVGGLHVLTDVMLQKRYSHAELAAMARQGGADIVQLRDKRGLPEAELAEIARGVAEELVGGPRLIINDRVDVAALVAADGVHVGLDDPDPRVARATLGADKIVGATANTMGQAQLFARREVDYLGVGPVFKTTSKPGAADPLGLKRLREIVEAVDVPVVAIGGITAARVPDVMATGVAGIAVLSEVTCAHDPVEACARVKEALEQALAMR